MFDFDLLFSKLVYWNCKINKKNLMMKYFSIMFNILIRLIFSCDISPFAAIGKNVKFLHSVGIVIGCTSVIHDDVVIMGNVVLGAKYYPNYTKGKRHPTIGKGSVIGSNSVILGNITVGENCVIGAGSVITKNIENNSTVILNNKIIK